MPVVRRVFRGTLVAVILSVMSGCMSLEHLLDPDQKLIMYGGVNSSLEYMEDEESSIFGNVMRAIDLPFTFVGDTLLLPISAPVELSRGDDEE
jgi:uncharacterized protein YceK